MASLLVLTVLGAAVSVVQKKQAVVRGSGKARMTHASVETQGEYENRPAASAKCRTGRRRVR